MNVRLATLLTGAVAPLGPGGVTSAIAKTPRRGLLHLRFDGLEGDAQADLKHHGGTEKALHHYAFEHYSLWRAELGAELGAPPACLGAPGAFGENLSTAGMDETNVCIGDLYRLGGALIEVSQARQPCFKLNLRFAVPDMARRVQNTGRTGWYYRVREEGMIGAGDEFHLVERPHPAWTLARALETLYVRVLDRDALAGMAALPQLAESWRRLAIRRLESGTVEDWKKRLEGGTAANPVN